MDILWALLSLFTAETPETDPLEGEDPDRTKTGAGG
jgi:hypothetical protein